MKVTGTQASCVIVCTVVLSCSLSAVRAWGDGGVVVLPLEGMAVIPLKISGAGGDQQSADTFSTVESAGRIWMDRNLGASRVAQTRDDQDSYGGLYQWGRAEDGHQSRMSQTIAVLSSTDTPDHDRFITNGQLVPPNDWRDPQNENLWQGRDGINNPCPDGFRVPTKTELNQERISWGREHQNATGAFNSPLKLTVGGLRLYRLGTIQFVAEYGDYWTSTVNPDGRSANLWFYSDDADMGDSHRAYGFSVRCIKD